MTASSRQPQGLQAGQRIPRATYRLQFNEHFRLVDALALVPYLNELGVSHIYASPLLKAVPHSTHGYDVCEFNQLNPELGTEEDLDKLVTALRERGMGLVLDIVPNHMDITTPENRWWRDVLARGQASEFADYFDIDWQSPDPRLRGKILLPVLGDHYERVLQRGELQLSDSGGVLNLHYLQNEFPIAARAAAIDLHQLNCDRVALDSLIQEQHYRLAFWRDGDSQLNYRRFFSITSLAGIRVEDERVFNDSHTLISRWLKRNWLDGLRVDHPDGLRDPEQYLHRLRNAAPESWIVIEKILEPMERLPPSWPVNGTTGYDFLNAVNGVFVDPDGEKHFTAFYAEFTGERTDYTALVADKKRMLLAESFVAEITRLTELLAQISTAHWRHRDFSHDELREAMTEFAACFPVYRTYLHTHPVPAASRSAVNPSPMESYGKPDALCRDAAAVEHIHHAVIAARKRRPDLAPELFDFLSAIFLQSKVNSESECDFIARFQQLTGPAMAKGVEDTTFYCFNRFVSLNEVGGDAGRFGHSIETFHEFCRYQQDHWPNTMLASSTHDTKRSEDVRARLNLLSEIPERWTAAVRRWSEINECHRRNGWPDRNAEYLFYQTLVGTWPLTVERALAWTEKSAREAKQHTSWAQNNPDYEAALRDFVTFTLRDDKFLEDLERFVAPLIEAGYINSLAQTLLKLSAPGIPDIYQGCELWNFNLVDPDNRRPVDFTLRVRSLAEVNSLCAEELWRQRGTGLPKLWLIRQVLKFRARRVDLFTSSSEYRALMARGAKAKNVGAFIRGGSAITIVPRLVLSMNADWADTALALPPGKWRDELTGESFPEGVATLAALLRKFPVALLVRKENE
jgi:(1->4)-alpha-D-glucan 1-alpha-D-glucosylmutase